MVRTHTGHIRTDAGMGNLDIKLIGTSVPSIYEASNIIHTLIKLYPYSKIYSFQGMKRPSLWSVADSWVWAAIYHHGQELVLNRKEKH